jgi:hypothetical protein
MPTGKLIIIDSKVYVMCKLDVIPHLTLSDAVSITQIQLSVTLHQHSFDVEHVGQAFAIKLAQY